MGLAPSAAWRALGPPPPGALQKEPGALGGRGRERVGREGLWLEGGILQLQLGDEGDLRKGVVAGPTSRGSRWYDPR